MPTKTTQAGREYEIDGKRLIWHPLDDDGELGTVDPVTIPLRLKMGVLRSVSDRELDAGGMFAMLEAVIPNQSATLDQMDVNDFTEMFTTWNNEYTALTGASLGESSGSSS